MKISHHLYLSLAGQISQVNENLSQISSMNASIQAQLEEFRNNPSLVVKNRTLLTALQVRVG